MKPVTETVRVNVPEEFEGDPALPRWMREKIEEVRMSEEIQAGRELDALIAGRVMGHKGVRYNERTDLAYMGESITVAVPHYSKRISDAWEVVEKMKADGFDGQIHVSPAMNCYARFENAQGCFGEAYAETPALVICRAALHAVAAPASTSTLKG